MPRANSDYSSLPPEAVLRLPDVLALVGLSRASVYAKVAEQRFPAPVKLTRHASGWRMGDVREWLADPVGWPLRNDNDAARG
ncbi:AlpA family phage regulatory protein [Croceicoccus ponticola]|uniref:AlpA family phage regulatory protein n=1 Tax=Croceicoccus ponticola TaxID=2217664 RepID=A0A437GXI0_9SPHN|nr:AlpA family phage regulatory protein [Croceicoccus ponticola]RVQ67113.1 AlpA family phage regulatory protein [Croceicoccus ponticola]